MESTLSLQTNLYPRLTPAGAFYAVSSDTPSAGKTLLHGLLKADPGEVVSSDTALNLLYRLQKLEFLYGDENGDSDGINFADEQLPLLMEQLSGSGKALLVDRNGLYLANANFHHEAAEELGLLAAEVAQMEKKHRLLVRNNLYINNNAWGVCDPSGQSELTFFPLYIGSTKLILVVGGIPDLSKEAFVTLVRILYRRYSNRV